MCTYCMHEYIKYSCTAFTVCSFFVKLDVVSERTVDCNELLLHRTNFHLLLLHIVRYLTWDGMIWMSTNCTFGLDIIQHITEVVIKYSSFYIDISCPFLSFMFPVTTLLMRMKPNILVHYNWGKGLAQHKGEIENF